MLAYFKLFGLALSLVVTAVHSFLLRTKRGDSPSTFCRPCSSLQASASTHSEMYQEIKGVIFDVDGTLADSWKLGFDATAVILDKNKIPPISAETYHECTRYATPERLARHAGLVPGDDEFEFVGDRLAQEFDDLYVGLVSTKTAGFFPGVHSLLDGIPSDVALGALTNAAARYAYAVIESNDQDGTVYKRFESIRGADNVPQPKPSPAGLLQVCQDLDLEPEDCVYIGDSPSDGAAARAAGMMSIGVTWGSHHEENLRRAPFNHVCRTIEELRLLLPQ